MSILIVGGAGYIGSQTAKRVAQAGLEPVVFDNLVYGHRWAVKWGPLVEGDLADGALIKDVLQRYQVTAVVHFAAYAGHPKATAARSAFDAASAQLQ